MKRQPEYLFKNPCVSGSEFKTFESKKKHNKEKCVKDRVKKTANVLTDTDIEKINLYYKDECIL